VASAPERESPDARDLLGRSSLPTDRPVRGPSACTETVLGRREVHTCTSHVRQTGVRDRRRVPGGPSLKMIIRVLFCRINIFSIYIAPQMKSASTPVPSGRSNRSSRRRSDRRSRPSVPSNRRRTHRTTVVRRSFEPARLSTGASLAGRAVAGCGHRPG
jgi:hypothetical protein